MSGAGMCRDAGGMQGGGGVTDHNTLERIARQLCESAGRDYDAKRCHRNHWRKKAQRIAAMAEANPVMGTLVRACGWRV